MLILRKYRGRRSKTGILASMNKWIWGVVDEILRWLLLTFINLVANVDSLILIQKFSFLLKLAYGLWKHLIHSFPMCLWPLEFCYQHSTFRVIYQFSRANYFYFHLNVSIQYFLNLWLLISQVMLSQTQELIHAFKQYFQKFSLLYVWGSLGTNCSALEVSF